MLEFLEITVDKFTFKVATDRAYTPEGLWLQDQEGRVWVGLTDFLQQRSGDVAFVEVKPEGTVLKAGDELAVIETIKVDTILTSPLHGKVIKVNPALDDEAEVINQDPYGEGWLAVVEPDAWETDRAHLLDPEAYFEVMKSRVEDEVSRI
jgi:glycine cleavage system H protein